MTMIFNGTELEGVSFNGVDCEKVYFNGALVFEKVAPTYVVALLDGAGPVSPDHPVFGNVWFGINRWGDDISMYMSCDNTSHTGRARVTFGGMTIILSRYSPSDWGADLTEAQWYALPKTGNQPIIIEAIP